MVSIVMADVGSIMSEFNILGYGVIGLGFLLANLSYRLLVKEQRVERPRKQIIRSIYAFMSFSLVLCAGGLFSEFYKGSTVKPIDTQEAVKSVSMEQLESVKMELTQLINDIAIIPVPTECTAPSSLQFYDAIGPRLELARAEIDAMELTVTPPVTLIELPEEAVTEQSESLTEQ